jgi:F-type H+-transporting ATPase subunit epsilon
MPFQLSVVTPRGTVIDEPVDHLVAPGVEGEFGVLPSHTPYLSAIQAGVMRYDKDGRMHYLAVSTGFAEVTGDHVTVLARTAERVEEIDRERAEAALGRAREGLRGGLEGEEFARLDAAAARASARLDALSR